jgi:pyrroloquinoline quinone biosynthesis protein B
MLQILILGAAAGGGFPQWNCNCPGCRSARSGEATASGQLSLAISADGEHWILVNASPDILSQIAENPELHPSGLRQSPISAVVLTNGEIDAVAGLLSLREGTPFELWATQSVLNTLSENSIFNVLRPELVQRRPVEFDQPFTPSLPHGRAQGLGLGLYRGTCCRR